MIRFASSLGLVLALCSPVVAQRPAFDVASIKPNTSGDTVQNGPLLQPGGRLVAGNVTLRQLVRAAFDKRDIVGGPPWFDSARFTVMARSETLDALNADAFIAQAWAMLQTLLAERFALRTHVETRQLPAYALVIARSDGALGPKLTKSTIDCAAILEAMKNGKRPPLAASGRPSCTVGGRPGGIVGNSVDMTRFATMVLADNVDRPVVDRTGLTGGYDVELSWSIDQKDGPSIFAALQEQLGLKLQPTTAPVEVLVIDSAQMPMPD